MSWSFTINDPPGVAEFELPEALLADMSRAHALYPLDMAIALDMAKRAGLRTATCTGMRTPSPYNSDEVVDISIRGMLIARKFNEAMRKVVLSGPETGGNSSVLHEDDHR
jgi:hypothetical protein